MERKRSCPSSTRYRDEHELSKTQLSSPRYHYEYQLSEDNSTVNPPGHLESTILDLVSTVSISFRVNYILRNRTIDETLGSIERCFYMRLYLITGLADYSKRHRVAWEYCQQREHLEYDVHWPETCLARLFRCHGVVDDDVIKQLIGDTKDFVNLKRANSSNRVLPISITLRVYTLQQEDETIDDAKQRAITTNLLEVAYVDKMIKLLQRPPPYKFMIEFDNDHEVVGGHCCICLSKLSVGEEVLFLSCSHAYHYDCIIRWLEKGNQCPLCRCPMNLQGFIEAFHFQVENLMLSMRREWQTRPDGWKQGRGKHN